MRELLPELSDLFLHGADSRPQVFVDRIVSPQGITSSGRRAASMSSRHHTSGIGGANGILRATRSFPPGPQVARGSGGASRGDARPGFPSGGRPSLSLEGLVRLPISAGALRLG